MYNELIDFYFFDYPSYHIHRQGLQFERLQEFMKQFPVVDMYPPKRKDLEFMFYFSDIPRYENYTISILKGRANESNR